jgi:hypothetical protein
MNIYIGEFYLICRHKQVFFKNGTIPDTTRRFNCLSARIAKYLLERKGFQTKGLETNKNLRFRQWRTEGGVGGVQTPLSKFRSFDKAEPK